MSNFYDKGNRVVLTQSGRYHRAKTWGIRDIDEGAVGTVMSKVDAGCVSVKFDTVNCVVTINVDRLVPEDPEVPRPRRLGEVPEGMLSPLDPRLDWLWQDAAELADRRSLCSQYDEFAKALGIPGRPKDFTVTTTVNGFEAKIKVKARSQAEADEMVLGKQGA